MTKFEINFDNQQDQFQLNEVSVISSCEKMLEYVCSQDNLIEESALDDFELADLTLEVDILICDNETIHQINKEYRGKDSPTDVISFALFADDEQSIIFDNTIHLGQIIISAEKTSQQAVENGHSFEKELMFLLSHGLLHLFGFDHPNDDSLEHMLNIQDEMIKVVNTFK